MNPETNAAEVKKRAAKLGFSSCGITDLSPTGHKEEFENWLDAGFAGTMTYMHRQKKKRLEPSRILPGAQRAIVVTRNYFVADQEFPPESGKVAKYARRADYHETLAEPLGELVKLCRSLGNENTVVRAYVDAGPVPERELAQRAGLGWIGKNTMLIDPKRGSFFFLASVLTDLDLATDTAFEYDRCGDCRRCLDACPTLAFVEPRLLDANRCISFLTIESRGEISESLKNRMDDWVFGCDVCQDVCPWNKKFSKELDDPVLGYDPTLAWLDLDELIHISQEDFETRFGWTPLERPGQAGMQRNALALMANPKETSHGK